MSIHSKIRCGSEVAIFTRNHRCYLKEAALIAADAPSHRVTFRSGVRWVSAIDALAVKAPREVYIVPVGDTRPGLVEYVADLCDVHLDPVIGQPHTDELLRLSLASTKAEGLWAKHGKKVRTLYVLSNCRALDKPFPMTDLVMVSTDKYLSEDYGYSYSIVYAYRKRRLLDDSVATRPT